MGLKCFQGLEISFIIKGIVFVSIIEIIKNIKLHLSDTVLPSYIKLERLVI